MTLGRDTFELSKGDYSAKLGRIIKNHRVNSLLIGEPAEFVIRSCKLTEKWGKLATDPEVKVRLRNLDIAGGRKVKMLSLERGETKQPVGKAKLVDELYPVKRVATTASPEEKNYNSVKAAMRRGVTDQLKEYRDSIKLPVICAISGMKIVKGMKTDVDHSSLTFSEIADRFLMDREMKYTDVSLCGPPTGKRFKDTELWEDWQDFHYDTAKYSLVLASANRSEGGKGYSTPEELYGSWATEDPDSMSLDF